MWLALDRDDSGLIDAGEFGAFMRRGEADAKRVPIHEMRRQLATAQSYQVYVNKEAVARREVPT